MTFSRMLDAILRMRVPIIEQVQLGCISKEYHPTASDETIA